MRQVCTLCGLSPEIIGQNLAAFPVLRLVAFHKCFVCGRVACSKCSRELEGYRLCRDCLCLAIKTLNKKIAKSHS